MSETDGRLQEASLMLFLTKGVTLAIRGLGVLMAFTVRIQTFVNIVCLINTFNICCLCAIKSFVSRVKSKQDS